VVKYRRKLFASIPQCLIFIAGIFLVFAGRESFSTEVEKSARHHYALIDAGSIPYSALDFLKKEKNDVVIFYRHYKEIADMGPVLIRLDGLGPAMKQQVEKLIQPVEGKIFFNLLDSDLDLTALAQHLKRFNVFKAEGNLYLLRYADGRTIAQSHNRTVASDSDASTMASVSCPYYALAICQRAGRHSCVHTFFAGKQGGRLGQ